MNKEQVNVEEVLEEIEQEVIDIVKTGKQRTDIISFLLNKKEVKGWADRCKFEEFVQLIELVDVIMFERKIAQRGQSYQHLIEQTDSKEHLKTIKEAKRKWMKKEGLEEEFVDSLVYKFL
ncbi:MULTISPECIES: hypothetical protein [unclassified Bacillus cereus group]|uniref:hypothetical protein n=1 Tax=unclassified Bacillus cereus group TaxID=2750818 RepID=UPI001F598C51|nr:MULTISPECIES: hypothetical protein [unclassified Bacillus cereus group]